MSDPINILVMDDGATWGGVGFTLMKVSPEYHEDLCHSDDPASVPWVDELTAEDLRKLLLNVAHVLPPALGLVAAELSRAASFLPAGD